MNKYLKRMLCAFAVVMMVFAMTACGGEDAGEKTIVGEWRAVIDGTEIANNMFAEGSLGVDVELPEFTMAMNLSVKSDGTFNMSWDKAHLESQMNNLMSSVWDLAIKVTAEQTGMSAADAEAMMAMAGVTKEALTSEMDVEEMFDVMDINGYWKQEGDKLYFDDTQNFDDDEVTIEFAGDSFTVNALPGADLDEMAEYILPMVFNRK